MRNDEQRYIHDGRDVRFAPNSGHIAAMHHLTRWANSGLMHRNIIGEAYTERPFRRGLSESDQVF